MSSNCGMLHQICGPFRTFLLQGSEDALDLLAKLVAFNPQRRLTAPQALEHPYFKNAPRPSEAARLPKPPIRAHNPLQLQQEVIFKCSHPSCATTRRPPACEALLTSINCAQHYGFSPCASSSSRNCNIHIACRSLSSGLVRLIAILVIQCCTQGGSAIQAAPMQEGVLDTEGKGVKRKLDLSSE